MLTLERARSELAALPTLARLGLVVLALGGLADVVAHLEAAGHVGHLHEHTAAQLSSHLVAFVGMVLILLGVVIDGVRQTLRGRSATDQHKGVA